MRNNEYDPQLSARLPRTVVVTSGKGGAGKTSVAINLAVTLASFDLRVTLLDAAYALGDIDVLLGLGSDGRLGEVLRSRLPIEDVAMAGPNGLQIVPSSTGDLDLIDLSNEQLNTLRAELARLTDGTDLLIVDTASGIDADVLWWLTVADDIVVVTTPSPAAQVDAYTVLKLATAANRQARIGLLVNQSTDPKGADDLLARMERTASEFIGEPFRSLGHVPYDPAMLAAEGQRQAVVQWSPASPASRSLRRLARLMARAPGGKPQVMPPRASVRDRVEVGV